MNDPAAMYLRRSIESATPIGLIVLLFQRAILGLRRAAAAMDRGDIEERTRELNRVLAIVGELRAVLNHDRGGAIAAQFDHFYRMAESLVVDASCQQRTQPLLELSEYFARIRDAWQKADGSPTGAAAAPARPAAPSSEVRLSWNA